jgi:hypothetical protein
MKNLMLAVAVAMLAACAMPQGGMAMKKRGGGGSLFGAMNQQAQPTDAYVDEVIEIVTAPPGSAVLVNDGQVGYSPVKVSVRRYWRGEPGNMALDIVKVSAIPPSADGRCVQSAVFGQNNAKVISPVRLDMYNCSAEYGQPRMPAAGSKK